MKHHVASPSKSPSKTQDLDLGRWGPRQVAAFCSNLAFVSVPTSAVIGSFSGGADGFLVALIISGAFILLFGSISLTLVALGSIADGMRGWVARRGGRSWRGVGDEWLDGPT